MTKLPTLTHTQKGAQIVYDVLSLREVEDHANLLAAEGPILLQQMTHPLAAEDCRGPIS